MNPRHEKIFSQAKKSASEYSLFEKFPALVRMFKAWKEGTYKPRTRNIVFVVLSAIYVISPLDFIPEMFFSVFGLGDDIALVGFIMLRLIKEVDKFIDWENEKPSSHTIDTEAIVE